MTSRASRPIVGAIALAAAVAAASGTCDTCEPRPPAGTSFTGAVWPSEQVAFLSDVSWTDAGGTRHVAQTIFDEVFAIIGGAEHFVLVDMFLYNDFQGDVRENTRALADELTSALVERKRAVPALEAIVISDPLNTVYGGIASRHFARLEAAGIPVVLTNLDALRDSNPAYSTLWRLLVRPFGNDRGGALPSPFGDGRVSLRSYLAVPNFKANHRKLVIADAQGAWTALVTSANPHDASSAHGNAGVRFTGPAVADLLATERAVLAFSDGPALDVAIAPTPVPAPQTVQVLTEGAIHAWLVEQLAASGAGTRIEVAVFYLSDRDVIEGLVAAHARGAELRVLLDPNEDAFGYEKNGIPNRPVAAELQRAGIPVRWCDTHGEQCHAKAMIVRTPDRARQLLAGSANFTRRNLEDLNLETSVVVRDAGEGPAIDDALAWFERSWNNEPGRRFSVPYEVHADASRTKELLYRLQEASGLSSF
jgi:hypothetical protein